MPDTQNSILAFEEREIRRHWDEDKGLWYFSVIDVVALLIDQPDYQTARKYWNKLSERLRNEGSEVVTDCHRLKMLAHDGKMRATDAASTETLFRIVQSIPSPKAEPIKLWLAKVGYERIEELEDPEISIDRAIQTYSQKGYSDEWINQRVKTIEVRKELTSEWRKRGVQEGLEYAILTDVITQSWSGKDVRSYKKIKGLHKESLRDNMTNLELVLNMLAEATTTEISKKHKPATLHENKKVARKGGSVAGKTRKDIEKELGESVVSSKNAQQLQGGMGDGVIYNDE